MDTINYSELLKSYIKNSNLTLDELSERLSQKGLSATKQYLSRLQNGKNPPASDELNKAIAEITGGDPRKIIWQSFIEKAPAEIFPLVSPSAEERSKWLMDRFSPIQNSDVKNSLIEEYLDLQKVESILTVPVIGHIAAGLPILADEHIDSYMDIPNPHNYRRGDLFVLIVKGDSMEGSRIFEGDRVIVKIQPEVENGEIAVVNVNGYEATLKKVKKLDNGQVWLFPSNDKYDPILLDNEKARIIGKVIQVIFEP